MHQRLTDQHYKTYLSLLDVKLDEELEKIKARAWTSENFKFATAVSVMSSSRIEGETLDVARVGLFYEHLQYEKGVPFLLMLPQSLIFEK